MKICFITVVFNNSSDTIELVKSFQAQSDHDFSLVIVDNASYSQCREEIKNALQGVNVPVFLIEHPNNEGFGAGNNVGLQHIKAQEADWIVFINNDITIDPRFVACLKQDLEATTGSLVALPIHEHGKNVYAGRLRWLRTRLKHEKSQERIKLYPDNYYVIGAGLAIRRSLMAQIKKWDERYFLYFEDVDFTLRARELNYSFSIAQHAPINHKSSATTLKLGSPALLYYHYRNALLMNARHAPFRVRCLLPLWSLWIIVKQVIKMISGHTSSAPRAIIDGVVDFWLGRFGSIHDTHRY